MIDLHIHTHYSDGRFSPAEVVNTAAKLGVTTIAITDHDNTRGLREALPLAAQAGLEIIPGIELTCSWREANLPVEDNDVDVLGYGFAIDDPQFLAFQEALFSDIRDRISDCCGRLTAAGYPISLEDVLLHNARYPGSLHAVQALQRKGYAHNWGEAVRLFNRYWHEGRISAHPIQTVIQALHQAGGAAVLAHPAIVRPGGKPLDAEHLRQLVEMGLDGIEVYHFRLDAETRASVLKMAREFGLVVTGGSDMHGWRDGFHGFGQEPVGEEHLAALRSAWQTYQR